MLKEISPGCSLEGLMLKLKLQYFCHLMRRVDSLGKTWKGLGAEGEGYDRGWDGWMASLTRWTWVWVNSGSWWWTGRPGMLWFMGSQRVGHNWATELNWTESHFCLKKKSHLTHVCSKWLQNSLQRILLQNINKSSAFLPWPPPLHKQRGVCDLLCWKWWVVQFHYCRTSPSLEFVAANCEFSWRGGIINRVPLWVHSPGQHRSGNTGLLMLQVSVWTSRPCVIFPHNYVAWKLFSSHSG